MLSIRVDLLTGRYYATAFNDRDRAEWPPHPGRLFSALVSSWAESQDTDAGEPDVDERAVLEWLEGQGAPELTCSTGDQVALRDVHTVFVPVNDASIHPLLDRQYEELIAATAEMATSVDAPKAQAKAQRRLDKAVTKAAEASLREAGKSPAGSGPSIDVLPDDRGRQPRTFPCATPLVPTVYFTWPDADPTTEQIAVLDRLLSRVGRLGHSSSFVAVSIAAEAPEPTLVPTDRGDVRLRVPTDGLLNALEEAFEQHRASEPRILPNSIRLYGTGLEAPPSHVGPFSDRWFILLIKPLAVLGGSSSQESVRRLVKDVPLGRSLPWTRAVRSAVQSYATQDLKAYIGGHAVDGGPMEATHPAVVPLGFVGNEFADGRVRAFAIVPPRDAADEVIAGIGHALRHWASDDRGMVLYTDRGSEVRLEPVADADLPRSIRSEQWTRPAVSWASVTPVVLDRFPKGLHSADSDVRERALAHTRSTVRESVERQGLPAPSFVSTGFNSLFRGSGPVKSFLPYRHGRQSSSRPISMHVVLEFDEPVSGPLIIGGGRHLGYGLMRPLDEERR